MPGKIYLDLLILCGILSQGIIGVFADENISESSSFLVRRKRVISYLPSDDRPVRIEEHPYIVLIKFQNRIYCVGTILSQRVVITAAECAHYDRPYYKVISSSSRSNRPFTAHNVTEIKLHYGNHPNRVLDGIALFTIDPAIVYSSKANKIDLHEGPVLPGMIGSVSGWGYNSRNKAEPGTNFPLELRSIQVPILGHRECVNRYREFYQIIDKDICTFHPHRRSGYTDKGAPLVINDSLVGIFIRRGPVEIPFHAEYPDVFVLLQHTDYRRWIMANI